RRAIAVVDGEAGVGVGIIRHIRTGTLRRALAGDSVLVARLGLVNAHATGAAAPTGFTAIARTVQVQAGSADRQDIGGSRRIRNWGAAVAGRGDEGHALMARRRGEDAVVM